MIQLIKIENMRKQIQTIEGMTRIKHEELLMKQ